MYPLGPATPLLFWFLVPSLLTVLEMIFSFFQAWVHCVCVTCYPENMWVEGSLFQFSPPCLWKVLPDAAVPDLGL